MKGNLYMWPFKEKKPECEHEYEILKNEDFYDPDSIKEPYVSPISKILTQELKITFQKEFLEILKDRNLDEQKLYDLIHNQLEKMYQKEYEDKINEYIQTFKKGGHIIIQRCKKCGKITKDITWYKQINQGPNSVMETFFGKN